MELVNINTNDPEITKFIINFLRRNKKVVTKEFLKSRNIPDIASIKISSQDYINVSKNLTQEKLKDDISRSATTFATIIKILA